MTLESGEALLAERGVIIASGGFAKNPEMLDRYAPQYAPAVFVAGAGSQGDGLRMAQPWHCAYQIMDQAIFDTGDDRVRILDFGRRLEEGLFYVGDTLTELAAQIEIEPDVLQAAVARYNDHVDAGHDAGTAIATHLTLGGCTELAGARTVTECRMIDGDVQTQARALAALLCGERI